MWVYLCGVATEAEADIIIGLLEQENIPALKRFPGLGELKATYGLISGVDIYVPKQYLEKATELTTSVSPITEIPSQDYIQNNFENFHPENINSNPRNHQADANSDLRTWSSIVRIILAILAVILALLLIYGQDIISGLQ